MKRLALSKTLLIILTFLLSTLLLVACGEQKQPAPSETKATAQEVKKQAKETLDTTAAYLKQQKEQYLQKMDAKLKEFDGKINALKGQAGSLKEKARVSFNQKMDDLRKQQQAAQAKLQEMKTKTGKAWEDAKCATEAAMNKLQQTEKEASSLCK